MAEPENARIERVGIVGAGTMGAGIMINCTVSGLQVVLVDRNPDVLQAATAKQTRYLDRQVQKERLSQAQADAAAARLSTDTDMAALAGCDLVIEAVFENLDLKKSIFAGLDKVVGGSTILASNTSCLRLADIAESLADPGRFCGMHYFSPAEINPVVELIEGPKTRADVLAAARAFLTRTGKEVIACKDQNGFALNRFFCPYTNEAVHFLDEGLATTGQIDEMAKETFGLSLGPFSVMNIIGTATNLNAVRNLGGLGPFYAPAKGLVAQGEGNTPWQIEAEPAPLAPEIREAISSRFILSVLLPVTEELAEGTASLEAIDKGARLAFRFARAPGDLIADLGQARAADLIRQFAVSRGHPA